MNNTYSSDSDRINEIETLPIRDQSPSPTSNSESPALSDAKKRQNQVRNMIKGREINLNIPENFSFKLLKIGGFITNIIKNLNAKQASENLMEEYSNGNKIQSPFLFRQLFETEPELENEEEVKLGIHYSINFKDVYREGRKLGEV